VIGPDPDRIEPGMRLLIPGSPLAQLRASNRTSGDGTDTTPTSSGADAGPGEAGTVGVPAGDGASMSPEDPRLQDLFVTQFVTDKYNPTGPWGSKDCGPASLLMALRMAGVDVPYNPRSDLDGDGTLNDQEQITEMRWWMTGQGETGETNAGQVDSAAEGHGYTSQSVDSFADIKALAAKGLPVMVSGHTSTIADGTAWGNAYDAGPGTDSDYRGDGPLSTGHFISVTGYDAASDTFIVLDPMAATGPLRVSAAEVEAFYNAGPSARLISAA
jgi:hypothetical protein